jgi:hypothetical protein
MGYTLSLTLKSSRLTNMLQAPEEYHLTSGSFLGLTVVWVVLFWFQVYVGSMISQLPREIMTMFARKPSYLLVQTAHCSVPLCKEKKAKIRLIVNGEKKHFCRTHLQEAMDKDPHLLSNVVAEILYTKL